MSICANADLQRYRSLAARTCRTAAGVSSHRHWPGPRACRVPDFPNPAGPLPHLTGCRTGGARGQGSILLRALRRHGAGTQCLLGGRVFGHGKLGSRGAERSAHCWRSSLSPPLPAASRCAWPRKPRRRRPADPAGRLSRSNSRRPTSARIEAASCARWLPVSGTLQPVNQSTVKAKVSGDIRQVLVREGEAVKAGQVLARLDTADLEAKLTDRIGALEASRAQLALAEKTRTAEPYAAQAGLHLAECLRQRREQPFGHAGHAEVLRSAGPARQERVARCGGDRAAVGHRSPNATCSPARR